MKEITFLLILICLLTGCGSSENKSENKVVIGDSEQGRKSLQEVKDFFLKGKHPKYRPEDYSVTMELRNDTFLLEAVNLNAKNSSLEKGKFYFKSLTDSTAIVEVIWTFGIDYTVEQLYTVFVKLSLNDDGFLHTQYEQIFAGVIEKQIDLNSDGVDEIILKGYFRNKRNGSFSGGYNLVYLQDGTYQMYNQTHFGYYGKENTESEETMIQLEYITKDNGIGISSTVSSSVNGILSKGFFIWNGTDLILEVDKNKKTVEILRLDTLHTGVELWESFVAANKTECLTMNDEKFYFINNEGGDYGGCEYTGKENSFTRKYYNEDGFIEDEFSPARINNKESMFIKVRHTVGAASLCTSYSTAVAYFKDSWHLKIKEPYRMVGEVDTVYQFQNNSTLFVTRSEMNCMLWTNTTWNVYLLNPGKGPALSKIHKLIEFETNYPGGDQEIIVDSVAIKYQFDAVPISISVSQFKNKQTGDVSENLPDETKISQYLWDEETSKFVAQ